MHQPRVLDDFEVGCSQPACLLLLLLLALRAQSCTNYPSLTVRPMA